jgi:ABC-type amino acid transport substrate-binding protein
MTHARVTLILLFIALVAPVTWWLGQERHPPPAEVFPSGELIIGIDPSYPPFGTLDAAGEYTGIDVALGHALAAELGLRAVFVPLSYDGIYDAVITGRVDVAFGATVVDPSRPASETRYTWGYFNDGLHLISPAGAPLADGQDLTGKVVAVEYGSSADAEARRWTRRVRGLTVAHYPTAAEALDAVQAGNADAVITDHTALRAYLAHTDWDAHATPLTDAYLAGVVRADRRAVLYHLNHALLDLLDSGQIGLILDRHF